MLFLYACASIIAEDFTSFLRMFENDVYLFWKEGTQMKSQRALARGARNNLPDDVSILSYYLYVSQNLLHFTLMSTTLYRLEVKEVLSVLLHGLL